MSRKEKIPAALRYSVWNEYIGYDKKLGTCYCCETAQIDAFNFACGHVISEKDGGPTTLKNLRPVCTACNSSMGARNMEEFKKKYGIGNKTKKTVETKQESKKEEVKPEKKEDSKSKYPNDCSKCDGMYCRDISQVLHQLTKNGIFTGPCPNELPYMTRDFPSWSGHFICRICGNDISLTNHADKFINPELKKTCPVANEMLYRAHEDESHPEHHLVVKDPFSRTIKLKSTYDTCKFIF